MNKASLLDMSARTPTAIGVGESEGDRAMAAEEMEGELGKCPVGTGSTDWRACVWWERGW